MGTVMPRTLAESVTPCTYCGLPADTKDHVIPRAVRGSIPPEWLARCPDTVPACRECNSIASDTIVERSIGAKRREIQLRLRVRYRGLLEMPNHTPEEIEQLGSAMRQHVLAEMRRRDTLLERLAWPSLIGLEYLERYERPEPPRPVETISAAKAAPAAPVLATPQRPPEPRHTAPAGQSEPVPASRVLAARLPVELAAWVDDYAAELGVSRNILIRGALEMCRAVCILDDLEAAAAQGRRLPS